MQEKVITITSGKGGVGKTTTTANVGSALALLGKKVVVLDGDIGLRNLDIVMGLENRIVYDIVDYVEGRCRLRQALIRDKRAPELYLLPTAQTRDKSAINPDQMIRVCDELRKEFDYIIIDSPAGIEQGFHNALAPADRVLVVTNPEVSSVRDADRVIGLVESHQKGPAQLIINRLIAERVKKQEMLSTQDIMDVLSTEIIGIVPEDEAILSSSNRGTPVVFNGKSPAAIAYRDIARRLIGEDVPLTLPQPASWWQRLFGKTG
ncbi:MAG: septum site-determining protein MinD [Chloroflexi bacterium]|jgi:septum site-determining protein MinD|uniref:Septum site-determining protein MinD n=1 Tax=Candidatus Thermofonsia Clade 3 bacterium TaxID=2364212 RepID=A0A2M8QCG6_9CHLR|nr:septum site-determining protein MinD [Candidatus Roseilinea sp. NK_OTU-006]PJF47480.1 MAG: septum site-determining protein MinD [Candidatus Thermofonsia Clade 3 bacterium]RMG64284.1 MAG: septum site-determining protein MinD [Chloroflexota bacterium]